MNVECLVIGGGAAGMAAAAEAARLGIEVVVVEARKALEEHLEAPNATVLTESLAWGIFPGGVVSAVTPGDSLDFAPRVTVLATGAEDRLMPFPGWELQPVVTAAEALDLARSTPSRLRWIVAGTGEHGAGVALALRALGQDVIYADTSQDNPAALRAAQIDALSGYAVGGVRGEEHLEEVELQPLSGQGDPIRWKADFLCVAYAQYPAAELAWLSGCSMEYRPERGGYVPVVQDGVRTTADGVLVAGAVAGLCRQETAVIEGQLAGLLAAERLGKATGTQTAHRHASLAERARDARLEDAAGLRPWVSTMWDLEERYVRAALVQSDATLCRCEKVTGLQVKDAIGDGTARPGDIKRATRAGMGECQGRHCRLPIARAVAVLAGRAPEADPPMSFRPPVRPIGLEQLLRTGGGE